LNDAELIVIEPHVPFNLGAFKIEYFRVCHSIPDAMGIAITTPLGVVIHTGDFKIDHTPADGQATDFAGLAKIASEGVLLLFSDSTYAEVEGYTESEKVVGEALDRAIRDAKGRVMIATFASLISRVQQILNAAVKYNRKVTVVGRSMINNVNMSLKMGYLKAPAGTVISMSQARKLPLEQVVIVATGSQGEPTSALVRIANGEHQDIEIVEGDTVILSSSPIPGNETVVAKTIDNLFRQGANVLYSRIATVHVHGHASQEELKMMLALVRPKYFVPVHGEYRHLVRHADLADQMGIPKSNVFILEDGDVLELTANQGEVVDKVQAGHVVVDGQRYWNMDSAILSERMKLARHGVVTVVLTIDAETDEILASPGLVSSGFVELDESQDLFEKTSKHVASHLEDLGLSVIDSEALKTKLSKSVSDFLYKETHRRPTVLAVIEQI
jgi:ribonuclease J